TEILERFPEYNPDVLLFDGDKLRNKQKYNRYKKLLENQEVIENPKTKYDHKNRQKLLNFINEAKELKEFQIKDLWKIWQKQRVSNNKITTYNLFDLLEQYLSDDLKI